MMSLPHPGNALLTVMGPGLAWVMSRSGVQKSARRDQLGAPVRLCTRSVGACSSVHCTSANLGNYSAEINIWEYCVCRIAMLVIHKCELAILWDRVRQYVLSSQFHVIITILWDRVRHNRNNAVQSIPSDPVRRSWLNPRSGVGSRRYLAYLYEVFYFLKNKKFCRQKSTEAQLFRM